MREQEKGTRVFEEKVESAKSVTHFDSFLLDRYFLNHLAKTASQLQLPCKPLGYTKIYYIFQLNLLLD